MIQESRELARELHKNQVRRESGRSFFDAHLEPVAQMVEANSGDDLAIAATYLHDAIEDIGPHTRDQIAALSPEILAIVEQLTESGGSWEEEKQGYVAGVARMDWRALLISICDKTCNARDFVAEWKQGKFGKRPGQILWFFTTLLEEYNKRDREINFPAKDNRGLLWDLHALVGEMQELYENSFG